MMETSATSVAMGYDRALAAIHALGYPDGEATSLLRNANHLVRYGVALAPEVSAVLAAYVAHLERQGYDTARVDPDDAASAIALAAEIVARSRGRNDTPICDRCMPLVGNKAPYYRDPAKAPECVLAADPRYCACPKCGTMYRTPIHHLLGVMMAAKAFSTIRSAAASLTDALASFGERMPGLAQITISAGGVTATVTPKPPPATTCPHCGAPRG